MRLSAADIRTVTLSRERFLFRRLSPSRQKGANPQRAWLEGVERVSFWHLRRAERAAWDVAELRTQTADLTTLLDTVAATLDARRAAISGTDDAK